MFKYKKNFILLVVCIVNSYIVYGQCGCPGNNTDINITSLEDLAKSNLTSYNNLFVNLFYKYSFADNYYRKDSWVDDGPIEQLETNFSNLRIGYKPTYDLLIEAEIGYLINKTQINRNPQETISSSGLSDLTLSGRYVIFRDIPQNLEISAGTGVKIPILELNEWVPQNIQPSTGAYAIILNFFLKKYFPEFNAGVVLGHRTDINFRDKWKYKYGNSHITSLVLLYSLYEIFNLGLEFRNDIRLKDNNDSQILNESGMFNFSISPLLRFNYEHLALTTLFEYPFYQYFNGFQIANRYSFLLNLSYNIRF